MTKREPSSTILPPHTIKNPLHPDPAQHDVLKLGTTTYHKPVPLEVKPGQHHTIVVDFLDLSNPKP